MGIHAIFSIIAHNHPLSVNSFLVELIYGLMVRNNYRATFHYITTFLTVNGNDKKIADLLVPGEDMQNIFLYITATVIWGTTWLGIKLQLTQVPPILSVSYRFCLASLILIVYCLLTKRKLNFSRHDHMFMAIQGFTLFGLGYCMSYLSTVYLTSGLVAVVFSTIMMWNILLSTPYFSNSE